MEETSAEIYARGVLDGKTLTRLDHHSEQIKASNTAITKLVDVAQTLGATVQTLTEARVTDAATRIALAQAVKESKDQTEAAAHAEVVKVDKFWSPRTRFFGFIVGIGTLLFYAWSSTR